MAYQLLSGALPFNDWKNPRNPALSMVWRSILTDEAKMAGEHACADAHLSLSGRSRVCCVCVLCV